MGIFQLEYCCFCCDLRLGSLVIGYINLIGNIVLAVLAVYGIEGGVLLKNLNIIGAYEIGVALIATKSIMLVIVAVYVVFSVLLLIGIHKNKSKYIKYYLIYAGIFVIIYGITFFVELGNGRTGAGDIAEGVITILLNVYFLLVIKSFHDSIQAEIVQVSYRP